MTTVRIALAVLLAAPTLADVDEQEQVARLVKRAERAGAERHDVKGWWRVMAKDVTLTTGRRAVPGPHDVTLDAKALRALRQLRWQGPPSARARLYFNDETVDITGDTAVFTAEVSQHFFGGVEVTRARYELQRDKKARKGAPRWRVAKMRRWYVRQNAGGEVDVYDDDYWLDADERVAEQKKESPSLDARLAVLVKARRIKDAYDEAVAETKEKGADASAWLARSNMALELGLIEEARSALREAKKRDKLIDPPALLK